MEARRINVFITGASRGIGFAVAETLAARCAHLIISSRDEERLRRASSELRALGPGCVEALVADMNKGRAEMMRLAQWVKKKARCLDMIVLNAGFYLEGDLVGAPEDLIRTNLEGNVLANWFLIQELVEVVHAGVLKRIVIIGSTASYGPYPLVPTYGVAKWSLRGFAVNLREELRSKHIGVTYLSPGATWTSMWEGVELARDRLLEPKDIGRLILTMTELSPQAVVEEVIVNPILGEP